MKKKDNFDIQNLVAFILSICGVIPFTHLWWDTYHWYSVPVDLFFLLLSFLVFRFLLKELKMEWQTLRWRKDIQLALFVLAVFLLLSGYGLITVFGKTLPQAMLFYLSYTAIAIFLTITVWKALFRKKSRDLSFQ